MFLDRVVVPLAEEVDARETARALVPYLSGGETVIAVHVIEKADGAPDKASVEQRERDAEETFHSFTDELGEDIAVETIITYHTDIAEGVFEAATNTDATAIAFVPRSGSRWIRLLTGDVALSLVTETDRPVIALPAETD